jgi:hypothetical protein
VIFIVKNVPFKGELCTVTIGLAVQCNQVPISTAKVEDAREKFNRMFVQPNTKPRKNERNILINCNTGSYASSPLADAELHTVLKHNPIYKLINETILLSLSNPDGRREFFGLTDDEKLAANGEALVNKSIESGIASNMSM